MKKLFISIVERSSVRGCIKWMNVIICAISAVFWLSEYLSGSKYSVYWEGIFVTGALNAYFNWCPEMWNTIRNFIDYIKEKYVKEE